MKLSYSIFIVLTSLLIASCSDNNSDNNSAESRVDNSTQQQSTTSAEVLKSSSIVKRPELLTFKPFKVDVPAAKKYQHQLFGNNVAYIMEDHDLPLVQINLFSRAGWYVLDKKDLGVAYLFDNMLREGGTKNLTPDELNETLDFLATKISFSTGNTNAEVNLDTLSKNLDLSLTLMFDMLTKPRFAADRLEVAKNKAIERIKQRNDDTRSIEPRVWDTLMQGPNFFDNRMATADDINRVTATQLKQYTQKIFANGQLIVAISGDVNTDSIIKKLNQHLQSFTTAKQLPKIPDTFDTAKPGLYGVNKGDVTQSRVSVGHLGIQRGNKDQLAILVMNDILGGGGFTSRITGRVRSDEGLAYSAGSYFQRPADYRGFFRAYFQSKNKSVAYALKIVLQEIKRIRESRVSEKELNIAKQSLTSIVGNIFRNADAKVNRFASDDLAHIKPDYWQTYESKVMALKTADILRVAKQYLHPEKMRILVVGALSKVAAGDGEHGTLEQIAGSKLIQLPLRDPLTLKNLPLDK